MSTRHRSSGLTRVVSASIAMAVTAGAGAGVAHAGLLELTAELHGGYMLGKGLSGDYQEAAFHEGATGPTYGFLVGAEVFFFDFWIQHDQYVDDSDIAGTWTQFMLGMDLEYEFTETGVQRVQTYDAESGQAKVKRKRYERKSGGYIELGGALGFGVGTGRQVDVPLDNAQVTDKGFVFQVSAGGGWRLNPFLSFGVSVPVQTGFLFKSGNGTGLIEDESTRYQDASLSLLANVRLHVDLL